MSTGFQIVRLRSRAGSYFASFRPKQRRETKLSRTPSRYHPLRGIGEYLRSLGKPWGRKQAA